MAAAPRLCQPHQPISPFPLHLEPMPLSPHCSSHLPFRPHVCPSMPTATTIHALTFATEI
jgi:hypothetical protein